MSAGGTSDRLSPASSSVVSRASKAGIHRLKLPTPFTIGAVNSYVIDDDPLTLVDAGPDSGASLDAVQNSLGSLGYRVEDLGLIIVTHQHADHLGLVDLLVRRSGADVAAHQALATWAADWTASMVAEDAYADEVMLRHGVPAEVRSLLRATSATFRGWGASMGVTRPLVDGMSLALRDRRLTVGYRPGHSPSDIILLDTMSGALFAGDHLLPGVAPNALVARPLTGDADVACRQSSQAAYANSLRASRAMEFDFVLPGHGDPFDNYRGLIDETFRTWRLRSRKVHGCLSQGPLTAYQLAQLFGGTIDVRHTYHKVSSVLGAADDLVADGLLREEIREDGLATFVAIAPAESTASESGAWA